MKHYKILPIRDREPKQSRETPRHKPTSGGARVLMRDRIIYPADCANAPSGGYVVKHLLVPGSIGTIVGDPGAGKSILAPHIGYAVAQGRTVLGQRTKAGRVLYAAAENFGGMRQRVHALKMQHGDAPNFALVDCGNLTSQAETSDLLDTAKVLHPALVIIDTLAAAWAGIEENSPEGMGQVVSTASALAAMNCAVIIIHHPTKNGDKRLPRGHGCLHAAVDVNLALGPRDAQGTIRGALTKNRNGSSEVLIAFSFEVVTLGTDEDGDPITAPRAVEAPSCANIAAAIMASAAAKTNATERAAMTVLEGMAPPGDRVTADAWREACDARGISQSLSQRNRSIVFVRARNSLLKKGLIASDDGKVWIFQPS